MQMANEIELKTAVAVAVASSPLPSPSTPPPILSPSPSLTQTPQLSHPRSTVTDVSLPKPVSPVDPLVIAMPLPYQHCTSVSDVHTPCAFPAHTLQETPSPSAFAQPETISDTTMGMSSNLSLNPEPMKAATADSSKFRTGRTRHTLPAAPPYPTAASTKSAEDIEDFLNLHFASWPETVTDVLEFGYPKPSNAVLAPADSVFTDEKEWGDAGSAASVVPTPLPLEPEQMPEASTLKDQTLGDATETLPTPTTLSTSTITADLSPVSRSISVITKWITMSFPRPCDEGEVNVKLGLSSCGMLTASYEQTVTLGSEESGRNTRDLQTGTRPTPQLTFDSTSQAVVAAGGTLTTSIAVALTTTNAIGTPADAAPLSPQDGPSTSEHGKLAWPAAEVLAPTVTVAVLIALAILWWMYRREQKKNRAREEEMERKAEWFRPGVAERLRREMMDVDQGKVGVLKGVGGGGSAGLSGNVREAGKDRRWERGKKSLSSLSMLEREAFGLKEGATGNGSGNHGASGSTFGPGNRKSTHAVVVTGDSSSCCSNDESSRDVGRDIREKDRDGGFGWKVFHGRKEIKSYIPSRRGEGDEDGTQRGGFKGRVRRLVKL